MNLLRHSKLVLPEYPTNDIAWTTSDIREAAKSGVPEFKRRTCLEYKGAEKDLTAVLAMADQVLTVVSGHIGTDVVEHSWGLAQIDESTRRYLGENHHNSHELLPPGYALVATVQNVIGARALNPYWNDRIESWNPSQMRIPLDNGSTVRNYDLRPEQFALHPVQDELDIYYGKAVLVDIEPRLEMLS